MTTRKKGEKVEGFGKCLLMDVTCNARSVGCRFKTLMSKNAIEVVGGKLDLVPFQEIEQRVWEINFLRGVGAVGEDEEAATFVQIAGRNNGDLNPILWGVCEADEEGMPQIVIYLATDT